MTGQLQICESHRDLSERLADHLAEWAGRTGVTVEIWALPERAVPEHIGRAVFTCIVEALHNVELHSAADTVSVAVTTGRSHLRFTVSDSGKGFADAAVGRGISAMRTLMVTAGGSFSINGTPGAGTTVSGLVSLPICSMTN
ncbi:ATP-binding protein [Nonomuraea sp. B12E4]|uniref:sensor histidine kinase n=1 Tax=Nonomuraea sp. B12E4 TaxID=3153564 RepID=UPI00325E8C5D